MDPEGSLSYSQDPTTSPHREPHESRIIYTTGYSEKHATFSMHTSNFLGTDASKCEQIASKVKFIVPFAKILLLLVGLPESALADESGIFSYRY
jgi:hypothetical protein